LKEKSLSAQVIGGNEGMDSMKEATRDRYGQTLARLASVDRNIVALDCDLGRSTRSYDIAAIDEKRFVEMGIAEQDMISTAAGMAKMGKTVFANSFAVFITGRAFDQVRQQIALPSSNVKICGSSAGLTIGADGSTHQSLLDVALMRLLPNMTVLVPADGDQTEQAVRAACKFHGPVYLRLSRYETPNFLGADLPFQIGKAQELRPGKEIILASCGPVLFNVLSAADLLKRRGLEVGIVNFHTIKPFDRELVARIAMDSRFIVSVEEHSVYGGLGSTLAECLAELPATATRTTLKRIGVQDCFGESGSADELLEKHGLDAEGIARFVCTLL
jgi:transketolase